MMREPYSDRPHPPLLESIEILVAVVVMSGSWFAWYVARERYHLTSRQLAELSTYLVIAGLVLALTLILWATRRSRREREWPHPPLTISRKRDERIIKQAWQRNAVVLGYDIHGQPWYWPDRVRRYAINCFGHDWHRQNNPLAEHHLAGSCPRCRCPRRASSHTDGYL